MFSGSPIFRPPLCVYSSGWLGQWHDLITVFSIENPEYLPVDRGISPAASAGSGWKNGSLQVECSSKTQAPQHPKTGMQHGSTAMGHQLGLPCVSTSFDHHQIGDPAWLHIMTSQSWYLVHFGTDTSDTETPNSRSVGNLCVWLRALQLCGQPHLPLPCFAWWSWELWGGRRWLLGACSSSPALSRPGELGKSWNFPTKILGGFKWDDKYRQIHSTNILNIWACRCQLTMDCYFGNQLLGAALTLLKILRADSRWNWVRLNLIGLS